MQKKGTRVLLYPDDCRRRGRAWLMAGCSNQLLPRKRLTYRAFGRISRPTWCSWQPSNLPKRKIHCWRSMNWRRWSPKPLFFRWNAINYAQGVGYQPEDSG